MLVFPIGIGGLVGFTCCLKVRKAKGSKGASLCVAGAQGILLSGRTTVLGAGDRLRSPMALESKVKQDTKTTTDLSLGETQEIDRKSLL